MGNWNAKPGPVSEAGQTDMDRGSVEAFSYDAAKRATGKQGGASMVPNVVPDSTVEPKGRPKR